MNTRVNTVSIVLGFMLFMSSPLCGEATPQPRLITVTGDADVRVVPDEVVLTLGVETHDNNLAVAKEQNDAQVKKLLAVARDHRIEPKHVQTDYINIEPRYRDGSIGSGFQGYFVRKTVVLTLKDVSQFESTLSDVLNAGANYVHGTYFRTTELRKHRDQARSLAIKAAREKADALANELGQKVGKPHAIQEEGPAAWGSGHNSGWGGRLDNLLSNNAVQDSGERTMSEEEAIALGQINVHASVTVSFELE